MLNRIIRKWNIPLLPKLHHNLHVILLAAILLSALIFRIQGIFWGIPVFDKHVHSYHPDEPKIIEGAYNFPRHALGNKDLRYPTFYHYFLGALSFPAKVFLKLTEASPEIFYNYLSVFGRLVTILLGIGSVYLVFLLGRKFYSPNVGLLAALFISLSLYHVQSSGWATLDVPNSFLFILTIYFAVNMHDHPGLKTYLVTGISLGILIGTKYTGIAALAFILILHLQISKVHGKNILAAIFSNNLLILLASAGLTFLLTTPGIITQSSSFFNSINQLINKDAGRKYRTLDLSFFISFIKNFSMATDPAITIVTLCGFIYPFKKQWNREIPLIATVIVFIALFGVLTTRQLITVLPLTSILAANAVYTFYKDGNSVLKLAWIILLSSWITFAIIYNAAGILLRKNDTRTSASYYIKDSIPAGSTIGAASIGNYKRWNWMFPKIDSKKFSIIDALEKPEYIILTSYDFIKMEEALLSDKLINYSWDPKFTMEWYRAIPPEKEVFMFYDNILNNRGMEFKYRLIKVFKKEISVPIEFPPPEIRIYKRIE